MGKFEFAKRTVEIDIAGNKFNLNYDGLGSKMIEFQKKFEDMAKAVREGKPITVQHAIDTYKDCLNDILKDKAAFEKIFIGRTPSLVDCIDIINYITTEIKARNGEITTRNVRQDAMQ